MTAQANAANSNTVQLGCGTLILIALIVLIFSNPKGEELGNRLKTLRKEVQQNQETLEAIKTEIETLKQQQEEILNSLNPSEEAEIPEGANQE